MLLKLQGLPVPCRVVPDPPAWHPRAPGSQPHTSELLSYGPTAMCLLEAGSLGEDMGLRGWPSAQDTRRLCPLPGSPWCLGSQGFPPRPRLPPSGSHRLPVEPRALEPSAQGSPVPGSDSSLCGHQVPPPTPRCQETADNDQHLWGFQSLPTCSCAPLPLQWMELLGPRM